LIQDVGIDVVKAARKYVEEHSDELLHVVHGDGATILLMESNKEAVIGIIATLAQEDPTMDISKDEKLLNLAYLALICIVLGHARYGDFHFSGAFSDLRVRALDALTLRCVRQRYAEFRVLSTDDHKIKEENLWRDFLNIADSAGLFESFEAFNEACYEVISNAPTFDEIFAMYKKFVHESIFGVGEHDGNTLSSATTDQPALHLHTQLLLGDMHKLLDKCEFSGYKAGKLAVLAFTLPLFKKLGQKNYAKIACFALAQEVEASARTLHFVSAHSSFSLTNGGPGQGMDRICECLVCKAKEGAGDKVSTTCLDASARRSSARSKFRKWAQSFVRYKPPIHGKKGSAWFPSAVSISKDMYAGMGRRPITGARSAWQSYMIPAANKRTSFIPWALLNQMFVERRDDQITFAGFVGDDISMDSQCTGGGTPDVRCDNCSEQLYKASEIIESDEEEDETAGEVHPSFRCQACDVVSMQDNMALICPRECMLGYCGVCATDVQTTLLASKSVDELKKILRSILGPGAPLKATTKMGLLTRIREEQEKNRLAKLKSTIPGIDIIEGLTPTVGAILMSVGQVNLRSSFHLIPIERTRLSDCLTLEMVRLKEEQVLFDADGQFEVKLNSPSPRALGFALSSSESGAMIVSDVTQGTEAMRIGIRIGDILLFVSGRPEADRPELVRQALQERPAWMTLRRPDIKSPQALVKFVPAPGGTVSLAYYQPGCPGEGYRHTTEELLRLSPQARYLTTKVESSRVDTSDPLKNTIRQHFLHADDLAARQAVRGGRKDACDNGKASRFFQPLEPKLCCSIQETIIPLISMYLGGGNESLQRHVSETTAYVRGTFLPSLVKPSENRAHFYNLLRRSWPALEDLQRRRNSGVTKNDSVPDSSDYRAALVQQKLKEVEVMKEQLIKLSMDWRKDTPDSETRRGIIFQEAMALLNEAEQHETSE
jgi:hypothetical protein